MGTMWYHSNFKNLYRASATCFNYNSSYIPYIYIPTSAMPSDQNTSFIDTSSVGWNCIRPSSTSTTSSYMTYMTTFAYEVLLSILRFKYGSYDTGQTASLNNSFSVGYYTGEWEGMNTLSGTKSNISVTAIGLDYAASNSTYLLTHNAQRPVITFTNNSSSEQEINYIAYRLFNAQASSSSTSSPSSTKTFLMWVYQLDSSITIPPLGTVSIAFDSFLPST